MARILCAWELGGGYGHLHRLVPLAQCLRRRGHDVVFALKDLSGAETVVGRHGFAVLQAPVWLKTQDRSPSISYADILHKCGYAHEDGVTGLVRAWLEIYKLVAPDLVVLDHAPTALLAAHIAGLRRALIGTGFGAPPPTRPLPSVQPWRLGTGVGFGLGRRRMAGRGWGAGLRLSQRFLWAVRLGDPPTRRGTAEYARARPRHLTRTAPAPRNRNASFLRGVDLRQAALHLRQAALQCSVVVCHGGHGTTAAMLLAGKPLLLLPQHVEQALVGTRVAKLGAGLVAGRARKQLDYAAIVKRLVDEPSFSEKARAFASKYEDFDRAGLFEAIAARCEALLSTGSG